MPKELLFSVTKKDLDIQTFRAGGKGGQNQNKRDTGVRIIHSESGAVGESREHRGQLENKRTAFRRLVEHPKFKQWHRVRCAEILGERERWIDDQMRSENLRIEYYDANA